MSPTRASGGDRHEPGIYEIRVEGHLDRRWAEWFEGLSFTHDGDGTTILSCPVVDHAALYGLLRRVRDLALPLVSVIRVDPDEGEAPDANAATDRNRPNKETDT